VLRSLGLGCRDGRAAFRVGAVSLLMVCVWLSVVWGAEARDVTNPVGVWQVQADSAMCY